MNDDKPIGTDHARDLAMLAWFVSRGSNGAGQWPGEPDDFAKQNKAREEFDAWWRDPHAFYGARS